MADQVNPMGSLTAGAIQVPSIAPKSPPSTPKKTNTSKEAGQQSERLNGRPEAASVEDLTQAAQTAEKHLQALQSDLKFTLDEKTGVTVLKVVNSVTHEVIRQIPAEEVLAMAQRLQTISQDNAKDASGVLLDEKG